MEGLVKSCCAVLDMDKEKDILVVDPYMVSVDDLKNVGIVNIVRTRRPAWGQGVGEVSMIVRRPNMVDHAKRCFNSFKKIICLRGLEK